MTEKTFTSYLVLNWQTGAMTLKKRKPNVAGYWIPIQLRLTLKVPAPEDQLKIDATVEISYPKLAEIVVEEIKG